MPRLTRRQRKQLADIAYFVQKVRDQLTDDQVVVTMRSRGTTTTEYHNSHTGQWIAPVRPSSIAWCDNALRHVSWILSEAEPKAPPADGEGATDAM